MKISITILKTQGKWVQVIALQHFIPSIDPLRYQNSERKIERNTGEYADEYLTIKIRYKKPDGMTSMLMERPVKGYINDLGDASSNLRFAAAVSEFGMILRNSEFKGNSTMESVIKLAASAKGNDEEGYRSEFIRLVETAKGIRALADKEF
jgi:Ca-activated chloride channel family protein